MLVFAHPSRGEEGSPVPPLEIFDLFGSKPHLFLLSDTSFYSPEIILLAYVYYILYSLILLPFLNKISIFFH